MDVEGETNNNKRKKIDSVSDDDTNKKVRSRSDTTSGILIYIKLTAFVI